MIGFGFVDQTIMLQAGHAIDCTIGVTFGLSTLTSAAFGQVCSDASGAIFGSTLERLADRAGFPSANLTSTQKSLKTVQRTKFAGTLLGVISGCLLGLLNLLLIDTERSSTLKLQAFADDDSVEFDFSIEASNAHASNDDESSSSSMAGGGSGGGGEGRHRIPTTVLTVRGPDVDGVLASMTAALCAHGCSLVELHAGAGKQQIQQQQQQQQHNSLPLRRGNWTRTVVWGSRPPLRRHGGLLRTSFTSSSGTLVSPLTTTNWKIWPRRYWKQHGPP